MVGGEGYDLLDQGLVLVNGRNGEGKTALFIELPVWILYGRTPEEAVPGNAVRNRHHDGVVTGTGEFIGGSGLEYRVTRSRGKSDNSLVLEVKNDEGGWEDRSMTTPTETQRAVERAWGEDYDTFSNTRLFTSDVVHYPKFTDGEKKKVIDKILGLDAVAEAAEAVLSDLRAAGERRKLLEWSVQDRTGKLATAIEKLAAEEAASGAWEDEVSAERDRLTARSAELTESLSAWKDKEASLTAKCAKLADALDGLAASRVKPAEAVATLDAALAVVNSRLRDAGGLRARLMARRRELSDRKCGECGQIIPAGASERQVEANEAEIVKADADALGMKDEASRLTASRDAFRSQVAKVEEAASALKGSLRDKERALAAGRTAASGWRSELEGIPVRLRVTDNPHPAKAAAHREAASGIREELAGMESGLAAAVTAEADLKVIHECFGNRGFRTLMIEAAIPFLNDKLVHFSSFISSPIRIELKLKPSGELAVDVDHPTGGGRYRDCSRGQRRVIDLMVLFSFFELRALNTGGYPPAVVFDEAFENVDDGWQEALASLLRTIVDRGSTVFFISHHAGRLEGLADQSWTVEAGKIIK